MAAEVFEYLKYLKYQKKLDTCSCKYCCKEYSYRLHIYYILNKQKHPMKILATRSTASIISAQSLKINRSDYEKNGEKIAV